MKINGFPIRHSYKPARIISDILSIGLAVFIVISTVNFFPLYKQTINKLGSEDWSLVYEYRYSLTYRQNFAWIFPVLAGAVFVIYLILVLKNHRFEKYRITKNTAQSVYDWYAFAVSLCKLPLLLLIFDYMIIAHQRIMLNYVSYFSLSAVLYVFVIVIIIRLSIHRIRSITEVKHADAVPENDGVKAKLAEDNNPTDN